MHPALNQINSSPRWGGDSGSDLSHRVTSDLNSFLAQGYEVKVTEGCILFVHPVTGQGYGIAYGDGRFHHIHRTS